MMYKNFLIKSQQFKWSLEVFLLGLKDPVGFFLIRDLPDIKDPVGFFLYETYRVFETQQVNPPYHL